MRTWVSPRLAAFLARLGVGVVVWRRKTRVAARNGWWPRQSGRGGDGGGGKAQARVAHRLVEEALIAAVSMQIDGREETRLRRMRVDPAEGAHLRLRAVLVNLILVSRVARIRRTRLLRDQSAARDPGEPERARPKRGYSATRSSEGPWRRVITLTGAAAASWPFLTQR